MKIAVAIHDLMFSSKVRANAGARELSWLPRGAPLLEFVRAQEPDVLLVDLASPALQAIEAVRAIKADPKLAKMTVVGYVGHELTEVIEAAKAAGVDRVMSKGEFARRLPELLGV